MRNCKPGTLNFELIIVLISALSVFPFSISAYAESLDDIRIIKISPQDGRAVIKTPERRLRIIRVGDRLTVPSSEFKVQNSEFKKHVQGSGEHVPGAGVKKRVRRSELRVVEIAAGRVVFEEMTDAGPETVVIRLEEKDSSKFGVQSSKVKKQRIERIRKMPDKQPLLYMPK